MNENIDTFLLGSRSEFNDLCQNILCELKEKYPHIVRIYVRAEYPCISDDYKKHLLNWCDDTYYPERIVNAGKAVYIKRNYEIIEKSGYCIIYYNENYTLPKRKNSKRNLTAYQPKSGTKTAYEYAVKKCRRVIKCYLR